MKLNPRDEWGWGAGTRESMLTGQPVSYTDVEKEVQLHTGTVLITAIMVLLSFASWQPPPGGCQITRQSAPQNSKWGHRPSNVRKVYYHPLWII